MDRLCTNLRNKASYCYFLLPPPFCFLGMFATLRKATISYAMSVPQPVRPSTCMEELGSRWTDIHEIWYLSVSTPHLPKKRICPENSSFIKIWEEKWVLCVKTNIHVWSYRAQLFVEWETSQTKVVEKIKTHFMFSNLLFESRAVCEIMWKNTVWPDKATNTHSDYVILIVFPLQQWLHDHTSALHYTYIAWCV